MPNNLFQEFLPVQHATATPVAVAQAPAIDYTDRDTAIKIIKAALKRRSGKAWSVRGGRGTAWGWITIDTLPSRKKYTWDGTAIDTDRGDFQGYSSKEEREELAALLGLDRAIHGQGVNIPAGSDYRIEYCDRAEGRPPRTIGQPYWD